MYAKLDRLDAPGVLHHIMNQSGALEFGPLARILFGNGLDNL